MRVRGLKLVGVFIQRLQGPVAPHAGAWIETAAMNKLRKGIEVAPHAGA